jgi:serine phosphatase RsbU (regulator of sigma subunit)
LKNVRFSNKNTNSFISDALKNKKGLDEMGVLKSLDEIAVDSLSNEDKINYYLVKAANYCKADKSEEALDNASSALLLAQSENLPKLAELAQLLNTTIYYKLKSFKEVNALQSIESGNNVVKFQTRYMNIQSYFKSGEYDSCKAQCAKLLKLSGVSKYDKLQVLNVYISLLEKSSDYTLALQATYTADSLFQEIKNLNYFSVINPRIYYNDFNSQNYQQKFIPEQIAIKINLGFLLLKMKDYQAADNVFTTALKIAKEYKQTQSELELERNIGFTNTLLKKYLKAEEHYVNAEKMCVKKSSADLKADIMCIRAKNYYLLNEISKARDLCNNSIDLATENKNYVQLAQSYEVLAQINSIAGDSQRADYYVKLANEYLLRDAEENKKVELEGIANILRAEVIKEIIGKEKSEFEIVQYKFETIAKSQELEILKRENQIKESKFLAQKLAGEKALQDVLILKRELESLNQQKELEQVKKDRAINILQNKNYQVKIRLFKKQSMLDKQIKAQKEKEALLAKSREKNLRIYLVISLVILSLIIFLLYRNVKNSKAIKDANLKLSTLTGNLKTTNLALETTIQDVNTKNEIIELKNSQILESINYAKRIQEASLPKSDEITVLSKENFILYKPKDIISGDFYLVSAFKNEISSDLNLYVVGDCTGHGVPGAMLSLLCSSLVRQSITELNTNRPSTILNDVTIKLKNFFRTTEGGAFNDGMDLACCIVDRTNRKLYFSGAGRPLIHIREGQHTELKGEKHHIGFTNTSFKFTDQEMEIMGGDTFYLFSDGFTDQFNGKTRKRFMTKNLINLLCSIQHEKMDKQGQLIDAEFEEWKGDFMQMDDVCMLGIKI